MVGCARKQVGRAFQGGKQSQALSEMPGPAFWDAPRVYWQHCVKVGMGREVLEGVEAKQMGWVGPSTCCLLCPPSCTFSKLGFLSPLRTRGLSGWWEVSERPYLFYLLHPSSVWRSLFMKTWPLPPTSLAMAVFALEKSQCAPATSPLSCRGWVYHPSSDGWLFPEKIKVGSVPKLFCEKDATHSVHLIYSDPLSSDKFPPISQ